MQNSQSSEEITAMLTKYSEVISKVHLKVRELGSKLEEIEKQKRLKVR